MSEPMPSLKTETPPGGIMLALAGVIIFFVITATAPMDLGSLIDLAEAGKLTRSYYEREGVFLITTIVCLWLGMMCFRWRKTRLSLGPLAVGVLFLVAFLSFLPGPVKEAAADQCRTWMRSGPDHAAVLSMIPNPRLRPFERKYHPYTCRELLQGW